MPELRQDLLSGAWVLLAPERLQRPGRHGRGPATPRAPDPRCPFCAGREDRTPPETDAVRGTGGPPDSPGWRLRCVPNKFPAISPGPLRESGEAPFLALAGGGYHEVLVDSPEHTKGLADFPDEQSAEALRLIQRRARAFFEDPAVRAVALFKNHGAEAGASMGHSHVQLLGLPRTPPHIERRRANEARFFRERGELLLVHLAKEELRQGSRIVEQGGGALVFCPFASRFPYQALILPWPAQASCLEASEEAIAAAGAALARQLRRMKALLDDPPFNVLFHIECRDGSDPRAYPWHIEVLPRLTHVAGFEMGAGAHILEVAPEEAAEKLRESDSSA